VKTLAPIITLAVALIASVSWGHPVTFKDGLAVYSKHQPGMVQLSANYTFHRRAALGLTHVRIQLPKQTLEGTVGQMNALLYRYNGPGSQGNLYAWGGAGTSWHNTERSGATEEIQWTPLYMGGVQADFETQRIYTALQSALLVKGDERPYWVRYRFGIAPYIAEYHQLQNWFILQATWFPEMDAHVKFTPMMRFFYQTVLWEIGADLDGRPWVQLMAHF